MDVVVTPTAMVRFSTATVPFEMIPEVEPDRTQLYVPALPEQLTVFEALVDAAPAVAEMETTLAAGYVNVHCSDAGSLPEGEVNVKFSETVPFAAAVPEDRANESVCAMAAGAKRRRAMAMADVPRSCSRDNSTAIKSTRTLRMLEV
jgi:hypothetical protein